MNHELEILAQKNREDVEKFNKTQQALRRMKMSWFRISEMAVTNGGERSKPELGMKWIKENNITSWIQVTHHSNIPRILYTGYLNYSCMPCDPQYINMGRWLDHIRIYKQKTTKKCFLVVHDYDCGETYPELINWCKKYHLLLTRADESWYGYGTTTYIITPDTSNPLKKGEKGCRK